MGLEYRSILEKLKSQLAPEPVEEPTFPSLTPDEWDLLTEWLSAVSQMPRAPQLLSNEERTHWMSRRALVLEILEKRPKEKTDA